MTEWLATRVGAARSSSRPSSCGTQLDDFQVKGGLATVFGLRLAAVFTISATTIASRCDSCPAGLPCSATRQRSTPVSQRLISAVVDQAPGVHHLLLSRTAAAGHEHYVEDLLAATRRLVPPARANVAPALVEPHSPCELAVLRYLCSRLTYREIASTLYVSVNTVKSHVRSIFRKPAVATRADAVAIGRSRGLL